MFKYILDLKLYKIQEKIVRNIHFKKRNRDNMKLIFACLLLFVVVSVNGKFTAKDCREKMASQNPDEQEYYRKIMYKDGNCDQKLNNAECGYDGGDCCLNWCAERFHVSADLSFCLSLQYHHLY